MKKLLISIGIFAVVALAIILIITHPKKELDVINIGAILELTGPLAPQGERAKNGILLALNEINSNGGIHNKKIEIIFEDDKTDSKEGVAAFRKLITINKVRVIIGAISSSVVMSCAPIADNTKTLLFSCGATSPLVTGAGEYVFRNRVSGEIEVKKMAEYAANKLKLKTLAVIYVNNDFGKGNKDVFIKEYKSQSGQIVAEENFEQGSTDFRTQLAKIKKKNPDAIYVIGHNIETAYAILQSKELGIKSRFLSTLGVESPEVWKIAKDAAQGIIYTIQAFDPIENKNAAEFERKYEERYKSSPDIFAALAYDAMYIIEDAIKSVGYDSEKIKNHLYTTSFSGVMGQISFDKNGDIVAPIIMKVAKDGKFFTYKDENQ